jgi:hypothetical protein
MSGRDDVLPPAEQNVPTFAAESEFRRGTSGYDLVLLRVIECLHISTAQSCTTANLVSCRSFGKPFR